MAVLVAACNALGFAHARLVRSSPQDGAVLPASPPVIRAWFNEELDPSRSRIEVLDPQGRRIAWGGVDLEDLDRRILVVRVRRLRPGTYTVRWTAVSADDGYVVRGRFRFTVRLP
ncbi:MAG: copper resistance protein CopC [Armatimonadota bacterium]|nr:copper resistance protein CopC [Armatimonadota bacterium]